MNFFTEFKKKFFFCCCGGIFLTMIPNLKKRVGGCGDGEGSGWGWGRESVRT